MAPVEVSVVVPQNPETDLSPEPARPLVSIHTKTLFSQCRDPCSSIFTEEQDLGHEGSLDVLQQITN